MSDAGAAISQDRSDRAALDRVLAIARRLSASADLREILNLIIDAMRDTLDAERATVFEYDASANELFTNVAHGIAPPVNGPQRGEIDSTPEIRIPATSGLAGECAQARQIINVKDAYADPRFNKTVDSKTGFRTRSILTIPLVGHDGELVGVAQVLNKRRASFDALDEQIAESLAAHAAVAMRRGRLIEDRLMRQKLERDLELARTIQQSSLPASLPELREFDIAVWNQPAEQTGGDTYDVIEHDGSRVVLLMADATGHGIGPALSVMQLRSMVRTAARMGAPLERIIEIVNQQLCIDLPAGRFITAWFAQLDVQRASLHSISAGQAPLIHFRAAQGAFEVLDANTVPLGVLDSITIGATEPRMLNPGDIFAVISDGIIEATNPSQAQFGVERIKGCLGGTQNQTASQMISAIRESLEGFTAGVPLQDDCTAIIIARRADSRRRS